MSLRATNSSKKLAGNDMFPLLAKSFTGIEYFYSAAPRQNDRESLSEVIISIYAKAPPFSSFFCKKALESEKIGDLTVILL